MYIYTYVYICIYIRTYIQAYMHTYICNLVDPFPWTNKGWNDQLELYTDTGCTLEDLPGMMNDKEEWRERVREIRARSKT